VLLTIYTTSDDFGCLFIEKKESKTKSPFKANFGVAAAMALLHGCRTVRLFLGFFTGLPNQYNL